MIQMFLDDHRVWRSNRIHDSAETRHRIFSDNPSALCYTDNHRRRIIHWPCCQVGGSQDPRRCTGPGGLLGAPVQHRLCGSSTSYSASSSSSSTTFSGAVCGVELIMFCRDKLMLLKFCFPSLAVATDDDDATMMVLPNPDVSNVADVLPPNRP
jgi:hypothetical protein